MAPKNLTKTGAMKKPTNSQVEEEEIGLEGLTADEIKQVVDHFAALIRSQTSEKSSEAEQIGPRPEN